MKNKVKQQVAQGVVQKTNVKVIVGDQKPKRRRRAKPKPKMVLDMALAPRIDLAGRISNSGSNLASVLLEQRLKDMYAPRGLASHLPLLDRGRVLGTAPTAPPSTLTEAGTRTPRSDLSSSGLSSHSISTFSPVPVGDMIDPAAFGRIHDTVRSHTEGRRIRSDPPPRRLFSSSPTQTPDRAQTEQPRRTNIEEMLNDSNARIRRVNDEMREQTEQVRQDSQRTEDRISMLTSDSFRTVDTPEATRLRRQIRAIPPADRPINPRTSNPWRDGELIHVRDEGRLRDILENNYQLSPLTRAYDARHTNPTTGRVYTRTQLQELPEGRLNMLAGL